MSVPVEYHGVEPIGKNELTLSSLGMKLSSGRELTLPERFIAMTATASVIKDGYGPDMAHMVISKPDLPETVKGVLAGYIV